MDSFAEESCDRNELVVKVGVDTVTVDKKLFIEQSEFCKALFSGRFKDSLKSDIDLSEVTNNISDVKSVVTFMNTGEIALETENLGNIIKISSYLSVSLLDKYLEKFLLESLSLKNCLEYYRLSHQYGLKEVERKAGMIVKARFHDWVINDENTLDVTSEVLKELFDDGFLKFCSWSSLMSFIAIWLIRSPSSQKIETSSYILYTYSKAEVQERPRRNIPKASLQEDLAKLKTVLKTEQSLLSSKNKQFLKLFEKTMSNIYEVHSPLEQLDKNMKTSVLVTLSYRYVPKDERYRDEFTFDLCVYEPATAVWYLLTTFVNKDIKKGARIRLSEDHVALEDGHDFLYLMDGCCCDIAMYDYSRKVWKYRENFMAELVIDDEFEHYDSLYLTSTCSGDVYVVIEVLKWRYDITEYNDTEELQDENILDEVFFIAARYRVDNDTFHEVFRTERVPVTSKAKEFNFVEMSHGCLKVSKQEVMIFVYTTDSEDNIVVMYDLKNETPHKLIPFTTTTDAWTWSIKCIFEKGDKFLVITTDFEDNMSVLFECQLGSDVLNFDVDKEETSFIYSDEKCLLGTRRSTTVTGKESLWHIKKLFYFATVCREVEMQGQPSIKGHTPPPFRNIVSAHEMLFPVDVLKQLNPITEFLF